MSATEGTLEEDDLKDLSFEQLLTRISRESLIQEAPIFQFPDSVLVNIFSFLEHEDILTSVRLVCRKWLVVGRDQYIWNHPDFFDRARDTAIEIDKFVASCRYAKGVQQLTFPRNFRGLDYDFFLLRRKLVSVDEMNEILVHMPDLQRCVTPSCLAEYHLDSFCDALGRYCPLLTRLSIPIGRVHELKLTSQSSCFSMLKRCELLTVLIISSEIIDYDSCITPSFIPLLADCIPNLEEFILDSPNMLEPGCFEALANSSLQLKKLHVQFRRPSAVDDASFIPKLKSLRSLSMTVESDDFGPPYRISNLFIALTEDGGLCDLTELVLTSSSICDDSFYFLVENLKELTEMTLHLLRITDVSLHNVAAHCTKLETLSLRFCRHVTDSGVLTLVDKLKALKKIKLYCTGSSRTDDLVNIIQTTYRHIDVCKEY